MSGEVEAVVDAAERRATITTTFEHPVATVWTLWSDPEKLARWWGPPGVALAVDHHDLRVGGRVEVRVDLGDTVIRGHWSILALDPPRSLRFTFASDGLDPTELDVRLDATSATTTTMTVSAGFRSDAELAHALELGFVDGLTRSCASAPDALGGRTR